MRVSSDHLYVLKDRIPVCTGMTECARPQLGGIYFLKFFTVILKRFAIGASMSILTRS